MMITDANNDGNNNYNNSPDELIQALSDSQHKMFQNIPVPNGY